MSENEVQKAVAQLKLDGYQVRFTHWRRTFWNELIRYSRKVKWMHGDGSLADGGEPMSNGGLTQCAILYTDPANDNKVELVTQSHTTCSKDDQFCYAQGRRISLARAIQQMEVNLPYLNPGVYDLLRGELWRNTRSMLK